jgi:glycosyltransferase involved in cell wall biosynthesis
VLIVAENASERFGGEAVLPLRYFRMLRSRGIAAWLITHARVREELTAMLGEDIHRVHFVADSGLHQFLWNLGLRLDQRLRYISTGFVSRLLIKRAQRRLAKRLIQQFDIDVVHQPTPVSPLEPSMLSGLGAPVVFGPMNGAVDYAPGFRDQECRTTRVLHSLGRQLAPLLNVLLPGKARAAVLLVANDRTRAALPRHARSRIHELSENGVDLTMWQPRAAARTDHGSCRFVFVGRLIRSKGLDYWLRAFAQVAGEGLDVTAMIIGDGPERPTLDAQAAAAGILATSANERGKVYFAGWQPHAAVAELLAEQHCLVFPTVCECGGAVILEAMAMGLPVIVTNWGGPTDYVDGSCGILVPAESKEGFTLGLAEAMRKLARDPKLRASMGAAGRRRVEQRYTWQRKIDRVIEHYERSCEVR